MRAWGRGVRECVCGRGGVGVCVRACGCVRVRAVMDLCACVRAGVRLRKGKITGTARSPNMTVRRQTFPEESQAKSPTNLLDIRLYGDFDCD